MATVNGTSGNDSLVGTSAADSISGFAGNDTLDGLGGVDTLVGGTGDDTYFLTAGDILSDSGGIDSAFSIASFNLTNASGVENLTLVGNTSGRFIGGNALDNILTGSDGNDASINGRAGDDTMFGLGGNDTFDMSTGGTSTYGNDVIDGGSGVDTIDFGANARSALIVNLAGGMITGGGDGGTGTVAISNVENVVAGAFADTLTGDGSANFLFGGGANDTLDGGTGNDRLEGGTGADDYRFSTASSAANADAIVGFATGSDRIVLELAAFSNVDGAGQFFAMDSRFRAGAGLNAGQDPSDRIIYNTTSGELWYDADGSGSVAAQLIATLQGAPALAATDIHVVDTGAGTHVMGTSGNDFIIGTPYADLIEGGAGNDTVEARAGDDNVIGGIGDDQLNGGEGRDWVQGDDGNDVLLGSSGEDTLLGGAGNDTLNGESGVDHMDGGTGDDWYMLTSGDTVTDAGGIDNLQVDFDYTLGAAFENIYVISGGEIVSVTGNALDNFMSGHGLRNHMEGREGNDTLHGNGGNDFLRGGIGNDQLFGGEGDDELWAEAGNDYMDGGAGRDSFRIDALISPGPGGYGADTIDGGAGELDDIFVKQTSAVVVDLGAGFLTGGVTGSAVVLNIERFFVWFEDIYDDQVTGSAADNYLMSGAGNDTLNGAAGSDWLDGGRGNDLLTGGAGADNFRFMDAPGTTNADTITDFASAIDTIWLDGHAMAGTGGNGRFTASDPRFFAGAGASSGQDASDRVIYDTTSGRLWFDADGSGSGAAQLIATLQPGAALAATDIMVENAIEPWIFQGGPGDEHIIGGQADDSIRGGGGNDSIEGNEGNDQLYGEEGHDTLDGGPGLDTLDGGTGNDTYLIDGDASDILIDASGVDTVIYTNPGTAYTLPTGFENLTLRGEPSWFEAHGNELDNFIVSEIGDVGVGGVLSGGLGNDTIVGGGAWDWFQYSAGDGHDVINGGGGVNRIAANGEIDFGADLAVTNVDEVWGGGENDHLTLVEGIVRASGGWGDDTLIGSAGNDSLMGDALFDQPTEPTGHDSLFGGAGSDALFGEDGNDTLDGGTGNDTLAGGRGSDNYVFSVAPGAANADDIGVFSSGDDLIVLDPSAYTSIGGSGFFAPDDARYHSGAGVNSAHDASDRVIYNATTGQLWYDADGTGAIGAQLIATLQGAPTFVATDIFVAFGSGSGALITGTAGDDSLTGTSGNDTINGLDGNDTLNGNGGSDSLNGGSGHDSLTGGGHPQDADGGDILVGGDGNDTLDGFNHALFSSDPDVDTMDGGLGDDVFWADNEADVLLDAGGTDTVHGLTNWTLGAGFENLVLHTDASEFGFGVGNELANHMLVTYRGSLSGMGGNDTLIGAGGTLDGGDGDDLIQGNLANFAVGGAGNDTISGAFQATGGAGADVFHIDFFDNITDFATGTDTLLLDAAFPMFANAGPSGRFAAGDARFHAAAGADSAHDADDRVIYNSSTGDLWYDRDGTGSAEAFHLGFFEGAPALAATDIEVIHGESGAVLTGTEGDDTLTGTFGNDTIDGLGGNDQISGLEGADSLIGGSGNDTLHAGFDSSTGDGSADTLDGGLGDDEYHVASGEDTILADPGGIDTVIVIGGDWTLGAGLENLEFDDTASAGAAWTGTGNELDNVMLGTSEGGTLLGLGGNDTLILRNVQNFSAAQGGDGNDTLRGADQSSLFGNAGNDVLIAGLVLNTLTGGTGNDHFVFEQTGSGADIADFASGTDKIRLDAATMTALGTTGNFAAGDERFHAGAAAAEADDRVIWNAATGELLYDADGSGSAVAELIATVTGNVVATDIIVDNGTEPEPGGEVITGTSGNDSLVGTNGNDTLDGVSGNDTLNGLLGDDTYIAQTGDVIQDSGGTDTLVTTSTWNIFSMPIENVTLAGSSNIGLLANNLDNHVIGNSAANSIEGRGGSDTIEGGGGNDYFKMTTGGLAAFGFDVIDGGDGIDTVDYGGTALSGLDVDLVAGTVAGGDSGGGGGATITSIEKFISGNFNDRVSGSAENNQILGNGGNDTLLGLAGHDSLNGGDGNDWLEGGSGFDTLVGGAGNDSFVFSATGGRVTDFVSADQLLFDNTFFAALGAESTWAAGDGRFRAAAGATSGADADDRLVYNTTNGNLYYDADGAGGAASVLVTTLQNAPTLSSADITVI